MIGFECVAGAAVIGITRTVLLEDVVDARCLFRENTRSARVVPFGGVIENNIENDFDSCPVQRLHHVAKLVHRAQGS